MLKTCSNCGHELDLEASFSKRNLRGKVYWRSICKGCFNSKRRGICSECGQEKKLRQQGGICDNCYFKTQIATNPERLEQFKRTARERHLLRKYGLTLEQYNEMAVRQDNRCAICGEVENGKTRDGKSDLPLMVDHDHTTGEVRGLLCAPCNFLVGLLEANSSRYESAKTYLEQRGKAAE